MAVNTGGVPWAKQTGAHNGTALHNLVTCGMPPNGKGLHQTMGACNPSQHKTKTTFFLNAPWAWMGHRQNMRPGLVMSWRSARGGVVNIAKCGPGVHRNRPRAIAGWHIT